MRIKRSVCDSIISYAKIESPKECCGLLAGKNEVITHCFPVINVANIGEYEADSKSTIEAESKIRKSNVEMLAVYHSHPTSAAVPSRGDLRYGFPKGIIVSLRNNEPEIRAWFDSTEIELIVED